MIWIQIIGILFGVFLVYESWVFYMKKDIRKQDFFVWLCGGLGVIIINIFPNSIDYVLESLGFMRALDFLTIIGFLVISFIVLYLNKTVRKLEKKIDKLVENLALGKKVKK